MLELTVDQVTFAVQVLGLAKILSKGGCAEMCQSMVEHLTLNPLIYIISSALDLSHKLIQIIKLEKHCRCVHSFNLIYNFIFKVKASIYF